MPELPEVFMMGKLVRSLDERGVIFASAECSEKWQRDPMPAVESGGWPPPPWRLWAVSRGKELLLIVRSAAKADKDDGGQDDEMLIRFNMGMTGSLVWQGAPTSSSSSSPSPSSTATPVVPHTHLSFQSSSGSLLFVDTRRFGRITWRPALAWDADRSPDPVFEWQAFVKYLVEGRLKGLRSSSRGVADVLSDQKCFNGIGNYLRAEILHRVGVGPTARFYQALLACQPRANLETEEEVAITEHNLLLRACHHVPLEVMSLRDTEDPSESPQAQSSYLGGKPFEEWLRVYGKTDISKQTKVGGQTLWHVCTATHVPTAEELAHVSFDPNHDLTPFIVPNTPHLDFSPGPGLTSTS